MEMIREGGSVRVAQISKLYGVSEVTVRSDLEYLEAQGILSRVHGGAVGTGKHYINMDMSERYMSNSIEEAVESIGETANRPHCSHILKTG